MNGHHLVPLNAKDTVLAPAWGLSMVLAAYEHVLYGPDTMLTRSQSLTTLRDGPVQDIGDDAGADEREVQRNMT